MSWNKVSNKGGLEILDSLLTLYQKLAVLRVSQMSARARIQARIEQAAAQRQIERSKK